MREKFRTHFAHARASFPLDRMPKQPAYFDSQASAAASLGIDIYEIREAKGAGCKAFRSGRVYPDILLPWLERKRERARERQCDADSDDEMVSARD